MVSRPQIVSNFELVSNGEGSRSVPKAMADCSGYVSAFAFNVVHSESAAQRRGNAEEDND